MNNPDDTHIPLNDLTNGPVPAKKKCLNWPFNKWQWIKLCFIIVLLVVIAINTFYGFAFPHGEVYCFKDTFFIWTNSINKYFQKHKRSKFALLIVSSLGIDLIVFISFFYWALCTPSWRLPLALIGFYGFRGIVQQVFAMEFPEGYLWEYPGFPSLFVSYLKTRDFFFSGHVGFPILLGLEWNRVGQNYIQYCCWILCALEFVTMVFLRGHYSIDLLSGIIFSHYFFLIVEPMAAVLDNWKCMNMKENDKESMSLLAIDSELTPHNNSV